MYPFWHFDQLRSVCRSLSVAQRVSVLIVSFGVLFGMGWLAFSAGRAPDQFLLGGKNFSAAELAANMRDGMESVNELSIN